MKETTEPAVGALITLLYAPVEFGILSTMTDVYMYLGKTTGVYHAFEHAVMPLDPIAQQEILRRLGRAWYSVGTIDGWELVSNEGL